MVEAAAEGMVEAAVIELQSRHSPKNELDAKESQKCEIVLTVDGAR